MTYQTKTVPYFMYSECTEVWEYKLNCAICPAQLFIYYLQSFPLHQQSTEHDRDVALYENTQDVHLIHELYQQSLYSSCEYSPHTGAPLI
jgi:hypothetical protein